MLRASAVDWWDSSEETACDRTDWPTGQGLLRPSLNLQISIKTRPDWADRTLRLCLRVSAFIEAYDVFKCFPPPPPPPLHPILLNHLLML